MGWILDIAKRLSEQPDSGIAVLILAGTALEPIGGVLHDQDRIEIEGA
jgi:hypothetical protein